jgi:ubiquinone biosynthesis protein COQ9
MHQRRISHKGEVMTAFKDNKTAGAPDWADRTEQALLDAALARIPAHAHWDQKLVDLAAADVGLTPAMASLLLPSGPKDLAALLSQRHDERTLVQLRVRDATGLKIREKITLAVATRIDVAMGDETAVRRSLGFLALPAQAPLSGRLMWSAADRIWRWAGDAAADFNHYSKRAILSTVLASTLAVRLSAGEDAARRHLDARIDGVMAFEKLKSRIKFDPEGALSRLAGVLGRRRYGDAIKTETAHSAD